MMSKKITASTATTTLIFPVLRMKSSMGTWQNTGEMRIPKRQNIQHTARFKGILTAAKDGKLFTKNHPPL